MRVHDAYEGGVDLDAHLTPAASHFSCAHWSTFAAVILSATHTRARDLRSIQKIVHMGYVSVHIVGA